MKKCYNCNTQHQNKDKIFCDTCLKKQQEGTLEIKGSSTLVIYHTV